MDCSKFEVGDILRFYSGYFHYAVYIGDGEIVHYNPDPTRTSLGELEIHVGIIKETLEDYLERCIVKPKFITPVKYYKLPSKSPLEIRRRALRYVNKEDYNIALRNCEHFATWCVYGKPVSANVKTTVAGATILGTTAAGGGIGATIGGIVGTVVPGPGTLIGIAVGGLIGTGIGAAVGAVSATVGVTGSVVYDNVRDEIEEFD